MSSHIADALRRLPVLARPRRRRVRKPAARRTARPRIPQPRPARAPYLLTLSSRRIPRRSLAETYVPYLRMSGRWLEEHGFVIGSAVQVIVEHGRVTLISEEAEASRAVAVAE